MARFGCERFARSRTQCLPGRLAEVVPGWDSPDSEGFAALRLEPWRFRVFPGGVLTGWGGEVLDWRE